MLQPAAVIVQAEEQGAHRALSRLVPTEPSHDAVGGARVLDLDHRALAGLVGGALVLGHHPVETRPLEATEPLLGHRPVAAAGREVHRGRSAGQRLLQPQAALGLGPAAQVALSFGQHVEGHEGSGRLGGQLRDPGGGRMQS